jgi:hypothetical protein
MIKEDIGKGEGALVERAFKDDQESIEARGQPIWAE